MGVDGGFICIEFGGRLVTSLKLCRPEIDKSRYVARTEFFGGQSNVFQQEMHEIM